MFFRPYLRVACLRSLTFSAVEVATEVPTRRNMANGDCQLDQPSMSLPSLFIILILLAREWPIYVDFMAFHIIMCNFERTGGRFILL